MSSISTGIKAVLVAVGLTTLVGCANLDRKHGYVPSEDDLSQVIVGVDTRDTVLDLLGRPTSMGVTEGSGFYYVA